MWTDVIIAISAALVAGLIGWPLVPLFLRLVEKKTEGSERSAISGAPGRQGSEDVEVLRGGLWIGIVERALIAAGIVLGRPELMAIVVAIKGLGRFAEIKSSAAAGERFIIGTFASIAIAALCGVIGWAVAG